MRQISLSGFFVLSLAVILSFFFVVSSAHAAPIPPKVPTAPGQNKIVCFDGGGGSGGTCTLNTKGAKGSATLDNSTGGASGVYFQGYNGSLYGALLSQIAQLSFTYTGTPTAGSPRLSIPIDTNNDGLTELDGSNNYIFAFVPAITCNNGQGKVDVINDPTCLIYYAPDGVSGWPNWAAFAAAHPGAEVSLSDNYTFVIADDTGKWTVNNVVIGKPGK